MRSFHVPACAWLLSILLSGCGGVPSDQPDLGKVSGTVKLDGNPLANVVVAFEPAGGGRPSIGKTDESGHYSLSYNETERGAVVGSHKVSITSPSDAPSPTGAPPKDPIPAKYNVKSELTRDVAKGENSIDFDLTSK